MLNFSLIRAEDLLPIPTSPQVLNTYHTNENEDNPIPTNPIIKPSSTPSTLEISNDQNQVQEETVMTEVAITTTTALPETHGKTCPMAENSDALTQNQFSAILTNDCRYDKLSKPHSDGPLDVHLQIDVRHIEAADQLVRM